VLTIACFLWKKNTSGVRLPSDRVTTYGPEWVVRLKNMVFRNYRRPHRFVCITDYTSGLDGIETIPLWEHHRELGGCYRRLFIFSKEIRNILGNRFVCLDLDCVITGDLAPILDRKDIFLINSYSTAERDQRYNGSLILMTAGARTKVWDTFDPVESRQAIADNSRMVMGTDQAWIRLALGPDEPVLTEKDGVYDYKHSKGMKRGGLPDSARIVFFSGPRSPETEYDKQEWIRHHWR